MDGQTLGLMVALSKKQVLKYGNIGITNVYSNADGTGIIFELSNGNKQEVKFKNLNFMKLADYDKDNDGIIDISDISNFAKESEISRNALKLNGKDCALYFQKDIDDADNIAEGYNNKFLKQSDKKKLDNIPLNLDTQLENVTIQSNINKTDIKDLKDDNIKNKNDISQLKNDVINKKDELVKLNATDKADYLENKIDNSTIEIENNQIVAKSLDGLIVTPTELNMLRGVKSNIQSQINGFVKGMEYKGQVDTYADLLKLPNPQNGWTIIVKVDETQNDKKMFYIYDGNKWEETYEVSASSMGRDFSMDKIDLFAETKGILPKYKISTDIARQIDVDKKIDKIASAIENDIPVLDIDGNIKDSGRNLNNYADKNHRHKDLEDEIDLQKHNNKDILDKLSDDGTGLKYDNKAININQVIEYDNKNIFPKYGEENKIYVDKSQNIQYRWDNIKNIYVSYNSGSSQSTPLTIIDNTTNKSREVATNLNKLMFEGNANISSHDNKEVKIKVNGLSVEDNNNTITNNANTLKFDGFNVTEENYKIVVKNTNGENIGSGVNIFKQNQNNKPQFKTLKAGNNVNFIDTKEEIVIESTLSNERIKNINFDNVKDYEISNNSLIDVNDALKFKLIKDNPSALKLDGTNYVNVDMPSWGNNYTIEFKIKPSTLNQNEWAGIVFRGNGSSAEGLFINYNKLYYRNGYSYSPIIGDFAKDYSVDEFYHIAITHKGGSLSYYKIEEDGTFIKIGDYNVGCQNSSDKVSIGRFGVYTPSDSNFKGIIDDIRIWQKVLTEDEIKRNWNMKLTGFEKDLMAYYNCDEGSGDVLKDLSPNKYDATFNNPKWTNETPMIGGKYATGEVLVKTTHPNTNLDLNLVRQIENVTIDESKYFDNEIKYMVSFDGGNLWRYYNGKRFVMADISDIKNVGNDKKDMMSGLTNYIVDQEKESQLLFAINFTNNVEVTTPSINNISINYILGTTEAGRIGSKYVNEKNLGDGVTPVYDSTSRTYELKKLDTNTSIKVLDKADIDQYAKTFINGEENIFATRDGELYLTDGKGGYKIVSNNSNTEIDDTKKSIKTTYSSEKIESIVGDINNISLPTKLKNKSLQDQIIEVFTCANSSLNGKRMIGNAIGRDYYSRLSYENISNDIILQKKSIVNALKNKGIFASDYEELSVYADKINAIPQNMSMKNVKLNVISPFTKQIIMTKPTTIERVCTSVLEYKIGNKDVVQYECSFNNSDSDKFILKPFVVCDGIMKQNNQTKKFDYTKLQDINGGKEYEAKVDLNDLYKINQFKVIENTDSTNSLQVLGVCNPDLIVTKDDIDLLNVERLSKIKWTATSENNSKLLLLISTDSGMTWKGYNKLTKSVKIVDINSNNDIKNKGISIEDVNKLNIEDLELLRDGSPKIKFAYYFEKDNINDILFNDEIVLMGDMKGENTPSKNVDYKLESDGKTLTYNFTKDGTYTILYCDND